MAGFVSFHFGDAADSSDRNRAFAILTSAFQYSLRICFFFFVPFLLFEAISRAIAFFLSCFSGWGGARANLLVYTVDAARRSQDGRPRQTITGACSNIVLIAPGIAYVALETLLDGPFGLGITAV